MKFNQIVLFSIISSISCAPASLRPLFNSADNLAAESATAAGRPRLDRVQSAPAIIDSTRIPNPKIEEAAVDLASKTRREKITVGLMAGGVGGFTGGLVGAAVSD